MTAEELLRNTEDSELHEASNEVFVIDNDLRTIFVPASITNIGVESDDDVNRLYFQMPKQYGEFDLSEFNIRINYMNADNKGDIYAVTDKEVSGDNITFSWLVGRTAFAKKGNVRFIVCLKKTDDEGSVQKEFNTTVATLAVLEGLETSEQIVQENPDIIEEILKRLDTLETTGGGGGIGKETDPTVPAWAKNPTKPTYTATEVGADAAGTAVSKVTEHNTAVDAHNDIRLLVQGLTDRLNALADSDDDTLDQMSEIVAYIKSNKSLIDGITTGKVNVTDIIDNLTTNVANKPLSAAQGVALKALIDGITIPETLPNPQKLIFSGATTGEYDGSSELTVNIPESTGGGSYTLPIMSDTQLGGGKAVTKTDEDVPVAVDPMTGQLFVPTYPSGGGGTDKEWRIFYNEILQEENAIITFNDVDLLEVEAYIILSEEVETNMNFYLTSGYNNMYTEPRVQYNAESGFVGTLFAKLEVITNKLWRGIFGKSKYFNITVTASNYSEAYAHKSANIEINKPNITEFSLYSATAFPVGTRIIIRGR